MTRLNGPQVHWTANPFRKFIKWCIITWIERGRRAVVLDDAPEHW